MIIILVQLQKIDWKKLLTQFQNTFPSITDTNISLESFITYLPSIARDIHVHIKVPDDISNDNFQSMVSQLVEMVQNSVSPSGTTLQQVLLEVDNHLYLDYSSSLKFIL